MKRRKRKTKPKFKVTYEYIPSPDAEERLNRVYDMLFDKIDPFDYFDYAQYKFAQVFDSEVSTSVLRLEEVNT